MYKYIRMRKYVEITCVALLLLGNSSTALRAQGSPYLPLDHWTVPYLEFLIDLDVIADPSPLVRPFTRSDALSALEAADTTRVSVGQRRIVGRLLRYFHSDRSAGTWFRTDLSTGLLSSTHARRTAVRDSGIGDTWARGQIGLSLVHGLLTIATRPSWDYRLRDDPDYFGVTTGVDRPPTRFKDAYISASFSFGDIAFGAVDRNWGPNFIEGILISNSPYSYDHLSANLGSEKVRVGLIAAQLDDFKNASGETVHRYWVAKKLYFRLPLHLTIELWEGSLFAGVDRQFEPWFLNPLKISEFERQDQGGLSNNSIIGGDLELAWPGYPKFYLSLEVDDFPSGAGDDEPTSGAVIAAFEGRLSSFASWTAFYTAVSTLSYRSNDAAETVMRRGVGLARNQSDYDQFTLRFTTMPLDAVILQSEITFVRQGEGDFRQPFPAGPDIAATPVLHQGLVEKLLRLSVSGRVDVINNTSAEFEAAYHRFTNFEHVVGVTKKRFVGSISIDYRFDRSFLPW